MLTLEQAQEWLLAALERDDHEQSVQSTLGILFRASGFSGEILSSLFDTYRTWRIEHGQGPIPEGFRASP